MIEQEKEKKMINDSRRGFLKSAAIGSALVVGAEMSPIAAAFADEIPKVTYTGGYKAGTAVQELELLDLVEIEQRAAKVIPKGGFGYIAGGAGDEWTLRENRAAFERKQITPRVLTGKGAVDLRAEILGISIASPIIVCPMGGQGLAHVTAEAGMAMGAAAGNTIMALSTVSTLSMEQVAAAAGGPKWFQLYLQTDDGVNRDLLRRAKAAGYKAIVLTVDSTATGNREADARNNFTFPLPFGNLVGKGSGGNIHALNASFAQKIDAKAIEFVLTESGLPVIVKGISSPDDALLAIRAGASAIQISNHGGRQLDGSPATFTVLPAVAKAVDRKVPIILDSGIRRGQDVFKALASGADIVGLGRPAYYGLALGGWKGVHSVLKFLNRELSMVMQLAGAQTVEDIKRTNLA
ncbi:alpha-hydroxy-acid oxidizing protein [Variovorax sp. HW608]|uniref:alpha-hydroxy-acid oxidizing protein n=1 Tax=Variovorax sp. HW608 TaxID=1034889 RepID=UPI001E4D8C6E|nr:alpha-hydroxy-acid oxidizing protein [Variovorax sp. HW608]